MAYSWDNRVKFVVRYMYDIDNNGFLDKNDFECLAVRNTVIEGKGEWDEARFKKNQEIMKNLWNEIAGNLIRCKLETSSCLFFVFFFFVYLVLRLLLQLFLSSLSYSTRGQCRFPELRVLNGSTFLKNRKASLEIHIV